MSRMRPGLASRRSSAATSGSRYSGESDRTRSSQPTATESKNLRTGPLKSRQLQGNRATAELTARPSARTSGPATGPGSAIKRPSGSRPARRPPRASGPWSRAAPRRSRPGPGPPPSPDPRLPRSRRWPPGPAADGPRLSGHRSAAGGQVLGDGAEPQVDHSAPEALGIEPLRPPQHQLGVVDPAHVPLRREAAELPYREARSKADLQHTILRPHVEQGHCPRVPPAVRRAVGHEQARCAPPEAGWAPELGADGGGEPLSQLHGLDSFTPSSGLRRVLAVPNGRPAGPRRRAPPAPTPRRPARWTYRSPRWE